MSGIETWGVDSTSEAALLANTKDLLDAIQLCLQNHLRMPALTLIYCGIDFMAALGNYLMTEPAKIDSSIGQTLTWIASND